MLTLVVPWRNPRLSSAFQATLHGVFLQDTMFLVCWLNSVVLEVVDSVEKIFVSSCWGQLVCSLPKPPSTHLGLRIPFSAVFNFRHSPARFHSNLAMFSKSTLERCICFLVCIRLGCSKASKIYVYIFEPRPSSSPSPKALVTFYQWPEYDRLIPRLHSTVTPSWNRRHE